MALALSNHFVKKTVMPRLDLPPAEVAAKMLPNLDHVKLDTNRDVDVMEVHVDRTKGTVVMGTVMNNTAHQIHSADFAIRRDYGGFLSRCVGAEAGFQPCSVI